MKKEQFSEESILTDLLIAEKGLVKLYATALTEASEAKIRTMLKKFVGEVADEQNKIFALMQKKGLYEVAPAQKQKIDTTVEKFSKKVAN